MQGTKKEEQLHITNYKGDAMVFEGKAAWRSGEDFRRAVVSPGQ